jgi:hypothetical protein
MRVYRQLYGSVAIAPEPAADRIVTTRRAAENSSGAAFETALDTGTAVPILADAYAVVPIPAYKSSF